MHHAINLHYLETDMNATLLTARLSGAIYPVMILAGGLWGATGEPGAGLAALAVGIAGAISLPR